MLFISILLIFFAMQAYAQDNNQQLTWGSVVFTINGETVPLGAVGANSLTPVGAQQLAGAGRTFRERYITSNRNHGVAFADISWLSTILKNDEIEVSSTPEPNVVTSAQAFMQGLYPPHRELSLSRGLMSYATDDNGVFIDYPLNGYQYPIILTYGAEDPMSAHMSGHKNCPNHTNAIRSFSASNEFHDVFDSSQKFYSEMYPRMLFGIYPREMVSIYHATTIYEYLNYQYTYNSSARGIISRADVDTARQYASQWAHAISSGADVYWSPDKVLAIAGRSLAYTVMRALEKNVKSKGSLNKLSLMFGGYEPMMAFLDVVVSDPYRESLNGLPNNGASIMIDLFSMAKDGITKFPADESQLMVRLSVRNDTNTSNPEKQFKSYPMFGTNNKDTAMPYRDFADKMVSNMISTSEWCRSCDGKEYFCEKFTEQKSEKKCNFKTLPPLDTAALIVPGAALGIVFTFVTFSFLMTNFGRRLRRKLRRSITNPGSLRDAWVSSPRSIASSNKTNATSFNEDIEMLLNPATKPVKPRDTV
ncbi:hypothetical protein MGYG_03273 [Nannizzia gypsea CBS 118893]|uniref:Histidine acid phosphatase n=1 Tax=Arthroderma gypseum (strain ATCC MYA-4604 / CBS 118893) TaxID=535722 RepID=E4UMR6_ARTGP|nr:hypothetical protein MGYG_03273 [Nannizzia gypsea CBS 118893]EFR00270.1 hypothetical protein MGYG_03273 [Nannizzia gypsea CBS 118893]